jgi:uncharacterized membrane protein
MSDKPVRSLIKGFTWRLTGTIDTIVVSFFVTGKIATAFSIGGIEMMTKLGLYYSHERVWEKVGWGKRKRKESPVVRNISAEQNEKEIFKTA